MHRSVSKNRRNDVTTFYYSLKDRYFMYRKESKAAKLPVVVLRLVDVDNVSERHIDRIRHLSGVVFVQDEVHNVRNSSSGG